LLSVFKGPLAQIPTVGGCDDLFFATLLDHHLSLSLPFSVLYLI